MAKAGFILLAVMLFISIHVSLIRRIGQKISRISSLKLQVTEARSWQKVSGEFERQNKRLAAELKGFNQRLLGHEPLSEILHFVQSSGQDAGLHLSYIKPEPPQEFSHHRKVTLELGLHGRYHALGEFLCALESSKNVIRVQALWHLSTPGGHGFLWRPVREEISVFGQQTAKISIQERGGFLEIHALAQYHKQKQTLRVLVGQNMPRAFDQVIIIGGVEFPLVVTGNNRIVGDVTVGAGGVKAGTLKGSKFIGDKLVEGQIRKVSPPRMPFFDARVLHRTMERYKQLLAQNPLSIRNHKGVHGKILYVDGKIEVEALQDSLGLNPVTILSHGDLTLVDSVNVLNPVTIATSGKIDLAGSLLFSDALLYAKAGISVSGRVKGAMQLLTSADIRISGRVELEYPSILFTTGQAVDNAFVGSIEILENADITGAVILKESLFENQDHLRRNGRVLVAAGARVTGLVFSNNHTTIQGRVHGLVVADHFYLYESPTTYINWVKDAEMNRHALATGFKLPLGFSEEGPHLEIVTWNRIEQQSP